MQKNKREVQQSFFIFLRKKIISNLFWGRSLVYRRFIHIFILITASTLIFVEFGDNIKITSQVTKANSVFIETKNNNDLLLQGGNTKTVIEPTTTSNFDIIEYTTKSGDTVDSIAAEFKITKESIKLSNTDVINYYSEKFTTGSKIKIPKDFNGVLIKAGKDETIDTIMKKVTKGQREDVIEINNLRAPDYKVSENVYVLIPDGLISPPVYFNQPSIASSRGPTGSNVILQQKVDVSVLSGIAFQDPLSHPDCQGYSYSRGFSSWHNGVDLAKYGGCPIRAAAGGVVDFAGWSSSGEGYYVRINHGNGVNTLYFHGDGNIWVKVGDTVAAGQELMYMGCTGYCTGTHLHFSLRLKGQFINAADYVPYWRP